MKFKDLLIEKGTKRSLELQKRTGIIPSNGRYSTEKIFTFKDGSSVVIREDKDTKRMEYYDSNMNYITSFITINSLIKYLEQSNLIKDKIEESLINEESSESIDAEDLLRTNNFKIKSVHPTKFGTEYIMAKKYDEDEIKKLLNKFKIKFDENSIFVIV